MMYASFMQRLELSADFIVSAATARQSIWLSGVGPPTETNRRGQEDKGADVSKFVCAVLILYKFKYQH